MRKYLIYAALTAMVAGSTAAAAQQRAAGGLRLGNAGYGGSESLTDSRTTGAEFSSGTTGDGSRERGSIVGPNGIILNTGEVRGNPTRRLTAPETSGAEASGGTPSRTGAAGGAAVGR